MDDPHREVLPRLLSENLPAAVLGSRVNLSTCSLVASTPENFANMIYLIVGDLARISHMLPRITICEMLRGGDPLAQGLRI